MSKSASWSWSQPRRSRSGVNALTAASGSVRDRAHLWSLGQSEGRSIPYVDMRSTGTVRLRGGALMQVRLLGPLDVVVDGEPRQVRGLRRKAILATLALRAGEVVSTDYLVEVVWGRGAPPGVANALQSHISYLRGVLGSKSAVRVSAPGYVLDLPGDATDVRAVER